MNKILSVKDLEYSHCVKRGIFGTRKSFHLGPISFDMHSGETIAIIGNNGAGKSLLAKALVGAIHIQAGSIELFQDDKNSPVNEHEYALNKQSQSPKAQSLKQVLLNKEASEEQASALPPRTRGQDIRLILQHSQDALNPSLSIGSILTQTLKLNSDLTEGQIRNKIEETLVTVGLLREHYYFYRHMLSDGQQQRVALARALILDPKIIVADEPFAALDPSVRSQTINLILKLQNELGLGFVFISHNIGIVRHISDKVMVMDKGKIIEQGKTADVFTDPQQPLTQKLIQSHFSMVEKHFSRL